MIARSAACLAALMMAAMPGACSAPAEEKFHTLAAPDNSVQIDAPEDWTEDETATLEEYLVLSIGNGFGAFAQVFYYPDDGSGDTAQDFSASLQEYYGENLIGEPQETELAGNDAIYFEYSMVDTGVDGEQYNYHGYEYVIAFGADVVEVDIFYSQTTLEGKLFSPSDEQLQLLRSIAETARPVG